MKLACNLFGLRVSRLKGLEHFVNPVIKLVLISDFINVVTRLYILVDEVVQPRQPGGNPAGWRGCTTSPARIPSWSTRLYNLAGQDSLLVNEVVQPRRPGFPPGQRGCTTSPARRIPSWSTRWYSLAGQDVQPCDQEDSLLASKVGLVNLVGHRPVSYKDQQAVFFQTLCYPIGPMPGS
ncbi:uncharacterized protein PGTG_05167 [Puccinia graminis f. sp. tritici CRL 75-36-700-3]|uniref:Uncharacterized protein n=1 Tax=Puccinia graminis f. sp. tritici (strain CRL 75-36-700-3 / race SCCL) TaxID=418459 RepID=E3K6U2_PUCGT|nr:uncharacterized protein PGTG_05167 [Puccinia graminis f. sp. tritici CRL 75-36-700-3]EFP79942.2 hypothetical protein PGTG_05167 [Puccinia graminis f. sp. tritici CRL 75-36-700-3]